MSENNNLDDKLKKSYENSSIDSEFSKKQEKEKKKKRAVKVLLTILVIALASVGIYFIWPKEQDSQKEILENNVKIQEELNKSVGIESGNAEVKKRPKELLEDYRKKSSLASKDQDPSASRESNSAEEYDKLDPELTKSRINFYREYIGLDKVVQSVGLMSEEDGYSSKQSDKYESNNSVLVSDKYVLKTQEEIESLISHELEKRTNPYYNGKKEGDIDHVQYVTIIQQEYIKDGMDFPLPQYKVIYRHLFSNSDMPNNEESFTFRLTEEGDVVWVD